MRVSTAVTQAGSKIKHVILSNTSFPRKAFWFEVRSGDMCVHWFLCCKPSHSYCWSWTFLHRTSIRFVFVFIEQCLLCWPFMFGLSLFNVLLLVI